MVGDLRSLSAFASLVAWAFGRVGRWLVVDGAQFQLLYEQKAAWLEQYGISIAALWAEHFNVRWLVTFAQHVTARVNTTVTFWLVVLVFVVLGLLEVDDAARKVHALKNREAARVLLEGSVATARKLRGYLAVRTLMSIATGALVWAFAALTGLQFAAEWGVIALVLNYIPFIGPFVATLLPTLFALAQFASWQAAVAVFACLGSSSSSSAATSSRVSRDGRSPSRHSSCWFPYSYGRSCGGCSVPSSGFRSP
jgi:predicted PurR-regulated permease PerM